MLRDTDKHLNLPIAVTGFRGGTGASSLSRDLAAITNLPRYSAGNVRRGLAQAWWDYSELHPTDQNTWNSFQMPLLENPQHLANTLNTHASQVAGVKALAIFNRDQAAYDPENRFEMLPDIHMLQQLHIKPAGVFDGKLAVVLPNIEPADNFTGERSLFTDFPELSVPYIRFLLNVTPEESARRIHKREEARRREQHQLPTTPANTLSAISQIQATEEERIVKDWERYGQAYRFKPTGEHLSVDHLTHPTLSVKQIDTTSLTEHQVLQTALVYIRDILTTQATAPIENLDYWINIFNTEIFSLEKIISHTN